MRTSTQFFHARLKKTFILISLCILGLGLIGGLGEAFMEYRARPLMHTHAHSIPYRPVGLLLGTSPYLQNGTANPFFTYRIEAAAALYHARKISYILVSGDNSTHQYDEPTAMQHALHAKGVPYRAIFCDYAGFTTLDSLLRANKVFGQNRFTLISQKFHVVRALYLGNSYGLEPIAFIADSPPLQFSLKTLARERIARLRALWDSLLIRRDPHFLGPEIIIGDTETTSCNTPIEALFSDKKHFP